ncbi:7-deoxyloganetin glucosyltransferase [Glycine soja]
MLEYLIEVAARVPSASAIVFNTFDELERDAMNGLSSMLPFLYTIGPFPLLLNQSPQNNFAPLGSNLWKEDPKCLEWLESKESGSVVYVNFGSITVMSVEQLLEFAWGLANNKKPFLWIIRPDLVIGGSVILSSEFVNETKDRSLIANQPTNCRYIYNEWEIGIEIDTNVKRKEVEKLVNDLMAGEKGNKIRQKIIELKKKAEEATTPSGCSFMNLDKFIKENIKISGTIHPYMAGAKGSSCAIPGCDSKVMRDERGADILPCECHFKICKDCYIDAVKTGGGICPGCKEPYKNTELDEVAVDNGRPLPLPPPSGMSKMERRLSMMKSTKSALVRSQTGDFDHNRWLFETKGTYGYGNAIWPKEDGFGNEKEDDFNYLINRSKIGCISEIAIERDKEKDLPLEVILPHSNNSNIKKKSRVNVPFGQYDLKVASEEVGQRISGPTHSATKVYVRRNEVLRSNGKAQQFKEPAVDSNSVSKTDSMPSIQQDPIELQCALLKEMSLTYGEDANKPPGVGASHQ